MTDVVVKLSSRRLMSRADRRQLAIETTLDSLARRGVEGTSLRSVCRDMAVSPSLIFHYFAGWHELVAAAYALFTQRFTARLTPLLVRDFGDEQARLQEIMRHYMAADWSGEHTLDAMIAFWHLSRSMTGLQAPLSEFLAERQNVVGHALEGLAAQCGARIELNTTTVSLVAMMDGMWLQMSLNPGHITPQAAEELCWGWVCERLAAAASPQVAAAPQGALSALSRR